MSSIYVVNHGNITYLEIRPRGEGVGVREDTLAMSFQKSLYYLCELTHE